MIPLKKFLHDGHPCADVEQTDIHYETVRGRARCGKLTHRRVQYPTSLCNTPLQATVLEAVTLSARLRLPSYVSNADIQL